MHLTDVVPDLEKRGDEYHGPCPFCGKGEDRFVVTPDAADGGLYWCRRCNRGGDIVTYLKEARGLSTKDAMEAAGKESDLGTEVRSTLKSEREKAREASMQRLKRLAFLKRIMTDEMKVLWKATDHIADPEKAKQWCDVIERAAVKRWKAKDDVTPTR